MSPRLYLVAVLAGLSVAQARAADDASGYLISGQKGAPVSAAGGCVRTLEWTPGTSYQQCDLRPVVAVVEAQRAEAFRISMADRIGGAKYNQTLSEKRANAVREYLAARGVDGARIAASGVGETQSVTEDQCKGLRGKRLVSCLQADRFAEITVIGTQTQALR